MNLTTSSPILPCSFNSSLIDSNYYQVGISPVKANHKVASGKGSPPYLAAYKLAFISGMVYPLTVKPVSGSTVEISQNKPFIPLIPPKTYLTVYSPIDLLPYSAANSFISYLFTGTTSSNLYFNKEKEDQFLFTKFFLKTFVMVLIFY